MSEDVIEDSGANTPDYDKINKELDCKLATWRVCPECGIAKEVCCGRGLICPLCSL